MATVARAGPHRRVKDDEVIAHYARAGDGSPGVIRSGELAERRGSSAATTMHPRNTETTPGAVVLVSSRAGRRPACNSIPIAEALVGLLRSRVHR